MCLCGLYVDRSLVCCTVKRSVGFFRYEEAEIQQAVAYRVDTFCGNCVCAFTECRTGFVIKFYYFVFIAYGAGAVYLGAVDVEYGIVIV